MPSGSIAFAVQAKLAAQARHYKFKNNEREERRRARRRAAEAILKAGGSDPCASLKAGLQKGSSLASEMDCQKIYANCIDEGQNKGLENMRARSRESPLKWFITNNLFDETKSRSVGLRLK